tara:strand:- start:83 stop:1285 length:1203 start_codon:yes stop_codon:yes gene_type:complete
MGTTSSFFGGGGAVLDPVNPAFLKNVTLAANTQFAVSPTNTRGAAPITIPCSDTTFFLLEGNSTSDIYVSFWELGSSGAATQLATAVQISGCDEVAAASSNGINRLMVVGGSNYNIIYGIYYNGSNLAVSTVRSSSTATFQPLCTCTCTLDGTLIGCVTTNSGDTSFAYTAAILTDGTVLTGTSNTNFQRDNYSRLIGTESGLMGVGRKTNVSNEFASILISIFPDTNSSLLTINDFTSDITMNTQANMVSNYAPFIVPTKGGIRAIFIDDNRFMYDFVVNSRDAKMLQITQNTPSSRTSDTNTQNMAAEFSNGNGSTFSRQANGTWIAFKGPQSSANYAIFEDIPSFGTPFSNLAPQGDAGSSGCNSKVSTSIVGSFVVATWYDETDGDVNIDVWNFKG